MHNYRNSKTKYLKAEDIIAIGIPPLTPIQLDIRPQFKSDVDRGDVLSTRMVYYAGVRVSPSNETDTLEYYEELSNGRPHGKKLELILPHIDSIKVLQVVGEYPQSLQFRHRSNSHNF